MITNNTMERNQACSLFIHVLNKDILYIIRSYMMPKIEYFRPTNSRDACRHHQAAKRERWSMDKKAGTLHLLSSGLTLMIGSEMANKFMMDLEYECKVVRCENCRITIAHAR